MRPLLAAVLVLAACGAPPSASWQGTIECDETTVASEVAGRVTAELVAEGQKVGDAAPLLRLDDEALRLAAAEADAEVALAAAQLAQVRAPARPQDLAAARAELAAADTAAQVATAERQRVEILHGQHLASDQDRDRVHDAAARATAEATAARERLGVLEAGARAEDIAVAEARLAAARATAARAAERVARCELRGPPGTRVVRHLLLRIGSLAEPGTPAVVLADLDRPYVDAFVPQAALAALKVGGAATVRVDGGVARQGTIERIGERLEFTPRQLYGPADRPELVARVRVRLPSGEGLQAGVPADVTFP